MPRFTIGCDPEFFLLDSKTGKLVSSVGRVKGTKQKPFQLGNGAGLQKDNVAVEFSSPVAYDGEDFISKIKTTLFLVGKNIPPNTKILALPSAVFDSKELKTPEAMEFGCDPDFNAWKMEMNDAPKHPNPNFRSCGGHVHVGKVEDDGNDFLDDPAGKANVIKVMDAIHGIISIILDNSHESAERRLLYGKAGCNRPTDYGVEYRVLSNFWLKSPRLVTLIDSLTKDALKTIRDGKDAELISAIGEEEIQSVINDNRVQDAKKILDNIVTRYISDESKALLAECTANMSSYELETEWA